MNHVYIIPSYHHRHAFAHIITSSSQYILSYNHIASRNAGSIYFIIALHIFIASLHHQQHIASQHNHLTLHHIIILHHIISNIHSIIIASLHHQHHTGGQAGGRRETWNAEDKGDARTRQTTGSAKV